MFSPLSPHSSWAVGLWDSGSMSISSQATWSHLPKDPDSSLSEEKPWFWAESNEGEGGEALVQPDRSSLFALLLCKWGNIWKQQILVQRANAFLPIPLGQQPTPHPLHVHTSSALSTRDPIPLKFKSFIQFMVEDLGRDLAWSITGSSLHSLQPPLSPSFPSSLHCSLPFLDKEKEDEYPEGSWGLEKAGT